MPVKAPTRGAAPRKRGPPREVRGPPKISEPLRRHLSPCRKVGLGVHKRELRRPRRGQGLRPAKGVKDGVIPRAGRLPKMEEPLCHYVLPPKEVVALVKGRTNGLGLVVGSSLPQESLCNAVRKAGRGAVGNPGPGDVLGEVAVLGREGALDKVVLRLLPNPRLKGGRLLVGKSKVAAQGAEDGPPNRVDNCGEVGKGRGRKCACGAGPQGPNAGEGKAKVKAKVAKHRPKVLKGGKGGRRGGEVKGLGRPD